jgi:Acetyltransferase (GNAT) domain
MYSHRLQAVAAATPAALRQWRIQNGAANVEWSLPTNTVVVRDDQGVIQSITGFLIREGTADGQPVRIGGIGGVMTHPGARCQGLARTGVDRALDLLCAP